MSLGRFTGPRHPLSLIKDLMIVNGETEDEREERRHGGHVEGMMDRNTPSSAPAI